ncbi:polyprenyl synthetase family protein [Blattabacterium sp. (Blattella germanica) str. Bge]|uniref:polyprenyl synthetase family protein n=1 Tax=Blattabacterium sp. (Blattella germanica) TaxID=624186 RepID=UPI0001BB6177|nr:polyprenyl synthetase family protein [Blattabacterium sp. (Blattella germanica)]ACY40321.1 polyprenyl synthetase family protein [Blattabacterium sp. (Blattella germanica) str. Bge]
MKIILDKIKNPIKKEINEFEKQFTNITKSNVSLIDQITHYIIHRKGKLIRPIFVFLIAKMLGNIQKKTYHTACLIELIHTATLVHDDVIDNSSLRRGSFSINAIWKNKIAVLIGDYLLSKSLLLATNNNYYDLLKIICQTIKDMSEGELLQMEESDKLNITEKTYNQIIYHKTASLIAASCECGARSVNVDEKTALKMRKFGLFVGIAFQIKDDLFDYEEKNNNFTGKPIGIDLREKKITLPLIYTIRKASKEDQKWILNSIKNYDEKKRDKIIDSVKKYGGLEYATQKMIKFRNNALKILELYPESPIKKALKIMVNFIVERNQ